MEMQKGIALAAFCIMLVSIFSSGCLSEQPSRKILLTFEPSRKTLTPEEEKQLRKQTDAIYTQPREQWGLAQKRVECHRETLEQRDWTAGDSLLNALFGGNSKCAFSYEQVMPSDVMKDRGKAIDKNFKDALDKVKK